MKTTTLFNFLGGANLERTDSTLNHFVYLESLYRNELGDRFHDLGNGYSLHRLGPSPADVAAVIGEEMVGLYKGVVLAVHPDHRRKGLGSAMVLAAMKYRFLPNERKLSKDGEDTLTSAWQIANGQKQARFKTQGLI